MTPEEIKSPPQFLNEREAADWWDKNPDFILQEFRRARHEGRIGHGTAIRKAEEKQAARSTTIRLDANDLSIARAQAEKRGLKYQTYLKMLIHEALQQAEKLMRN